jgi:hypothetical protein
MLFRIISSFFAVLIPVFGTFCQDNNIPLGEWRLHTPYTHGKSIDIAAGKLYVACDIGSMVMDLSDLSLSSLSKLNGLSDYDVNKYKYNKELGILVMAYSDGNLDLMKGNSITNVSDIKRKSIVGSKNINHIYFRHDSAFLSCDFGISLLDLKKNEIRESYENLSKGGLVNRIYAATMTDDGDSIFIASDSGVMVAPVSPNINLQDYNSWHLFKTNDSLPLKVRASSVCTLNNKVYAAISRKGIYVFNGKYWKKTAIPISNTTDIVSMSVSENKILICAGTTVISFDGNSYKTFTDRFIANPMEAVYSPDGVLWIADAYLGLVHNRWGDFYCIYLNGPLSNIAFKMYYYNNNIMVLPGGYNSAFSNIPYDLGYYVFDNQKWNNYPVAATALVDALYNPANGSLYLASYRDGIVEIKSNGNIFLYNNIVPLPGGCHLPDFGYPESSFMSALALDSKSNVWTTAYSNSGKSSLFEIKTDGNCVAVSPTFPDPWFYDMRIVIDDYDNKWFQSGNYGIVVFNENGSKRRYLTSGVGAGNLPSNAITALEKDKKGQIWIGTKSGVAIFYDPSTVFSPGADVSIPVYKNYPLLFGEYVTCIQTDGGNRKWIGTQNGLWLFNEDGTQVIANYTTQNSPLLSDFITDLEINTQTGELFIATDKGIISYRSDASDGTDKFKDVKVFPNPVTENFNGLVGISGLANNANVKITDIYGNLMYETTAHGGTASWNLKNYNGTPAVTGVYLIYSTTTDGTEGFVSKIAIVR